MEEKVVKLHTDTFTHKHFHRRVYTQRLLHTDAFTHRHFYTQTLLQTGAFTRRCFYTQKLLHTDTFTHKRFYTQTLLHTDAFTHRRFYTQMLLHTLRNTPKGDDEVRWNENSCFLMLGFWLCPVAILRLLQVHTVDQTVHPTPRHSFIALGFQGVPNAPARWYTNSKRTIETHVLHAWRCTDVSDWNLYATWTSSR